MKVVEPEIIFNPIHNEDYIVGQIDVIARTCYKSEDVRTPTSARQLVSSLLKSKHLAMLEHVSLTVKWVCDRGVSHEIVRHRIASYAQESTRFCNYSKSKFNNEIQFIKPHFFENDDLMFIWQGAMEQAEVAYMTMIKRGAQPQQVRAVLPNSVKTEIVITMNIREWRHFLELRSLGTTGKPHPDMRYLADKTLTAFSINYPTLFGDLHAIRIDGGSQND